MSCQNPKCEKHPFCTYCPDVIGNKLGNTCAYDETACKHPRGQVEGYMSGPQGKDIPWKTGLFYSNAKKDQDKYNDRDDVDGVNNGGENIYDSGNDRTDSGNDRTDSGNNRNISFKSKEQIGNVVDDPQLAENIFNLLNATRNVPVNMVTSSISALDHILGNSQSQENVGLKIRFKPRYDVEQNIREQNEEILQSEHASLKARNTVLESNLKALQNKLRQFREGEPVGQKVQELKKIVDNMSSQSIKDKQDLEQKDKELKQAASRADEYFRELEELRKLKESGVNFVDEIQLGEVLPDDKEAILQTQADTIEKQNHEIIDLKDKLSRQTRQIEAQGILQQQLEQQLAQSSIPQQDVSENDKNFKMQIETLKNLITQRNKEIEIEKKFRQEESSKLEMEKKELDNKNRGLQSLVKQLTPKVEEYQNVVGICNNKDEQIKQLQEDNKFLTTKNKKLEDRNKSNEVDVDTSFEWSEKDQETKKELREKNEELQKELTEQKNRNKNLETTLNSQNPALEAASKFALSRPQLDENVRDEIEPKLSAEMEKNLRAELEPKVRAEMEVKLREQTAEIEAKVREQTAEIEAKVRAEMEVKLQARRAEMEKRFREKEEQLQEEKANMEKQLHAQAEMEAKKDETLKSFRDRAGNEEREKKEALENAARLKKQLEELNQTRDSNKDVTAQAAQAVAAAKQRAEKAERDLAMEKKDKAKLLISLQELSSKVKELNGKVITLEKKVVEYIEKNNQLQQSLRKADEKCKQSDSQSLSNAEQQREAEKRRAAEQRVAEQRREAEQREAEQQRLADQQLLKEREQIKQQLADAMGREKQVRAELDNLKKQKPNDDKLNELQIKINDLMTLNKHLSDALRLEVPVAYASSGVPPGKTVNNHQSILY